MLHSSTIVNVGRRPASKKTRIAVVMIASAIVIEYSRRQHRCARFPISRDRRSVDSIFDELGPIYTRRACRMSREGFFMLHELLHPFLSRVKQNRGSPNGFIPSSIRLAAALRFFAGGSPYDPSIMH